MNLPLVIDDSRIDVVPSGLLNGARCAPKCVVSGRDIIHAAKYGVVEIRAMTLTKLITHASEIQTRSDAALVLPESFTSLAVRNESQRQSFVKMSFWSPRGSMSGEKSR